MYLYFSRCFKCSRYPEYKFLYNETYAKYAKLGTRNTARLGKEGFMLDVYMLAKCDFVVCTLTSNVITSTLN